MVTVAVMRLDAIWDQLFPAEQSRIVGLLLEKVIVSPNDIELRLRANGIEQLVMESRPNQVEPTKKAIVADAIPSSDGRLTLSIPIQIKRYSGRKLVVLPNGETAQLWPAGTLYQHRCNWPWPADIDGSP